MGLPSFSLNLHAGAESGGLSPDPLEDDGIQRFSDDHHFD